ncbi:ER membrane protein complex subunit 2-A [Grifola frondosa]|uniref:ER membrane protein complex subunit 2 n=1 Tax=Grifola frondosa TaxID=5627 RepID=A0A1C7MHB1_GRIFR|nr:ER membrane protein complex subunit 2-A [Grifola frondosa]
MDLTTSLQKLAAYRPKQSQKSKETFEKGVALLEHGGYLKQGDEGWDALERLALAALDQDNLEVADRCLELIAERFPGSPRVDCLIGIRMEATESPDVVLKYYDELLEADSSNAAAWRRKVSVLRKMGKVDRAVEELSALLDTFYTDVEGWLELADLYASCSQYVPILLISDAQNLMSARYTYALQSLSHALLLAPQNPSHFLQFAETAYLAGDITLSLKMFLTVVDMTDDDDGDVSPSDSIPTGMTLRAWFGVKLCTRRLLTEPRLLTSSGSQTPAPSSSNISTLDDLSTERLRTAYLDIKNESPPATEKELIAVLATLIK